MCTVTVVPYDRGFRVACNRDERRARPVALPPRVQPAGPRLAAFPLDPAGGGTWIGVNDAGVVVTLLNRTAGEARREALSPPAPLRSRGLIVRALLARDSAAAVVEACQAIDPGRHAPFRLVAVDAACVGVVTSDGAALASEVLPLDGPVVFSSSSLGDALVEGPRRRLFERLVLAADAPLAGQVRYHRHQWRARPHLSVCMAREDAETVSRTFADVRGRGWGLVYESLEHGRPKAREWCFLH